MRKIFSLILVLTMILTSFVSINKVYASAKFSDVSSSDWFYNNVIEMVDLGIIDGYPDRTFKPQGAVTVEQFLKMTLIGFGYDAKPANSSYWADGFIKRAEELKIVDRSFINDYQLALTREQAARIIANALYVKEIKPVVVLEKSIQRFHEDFNSDTVEKYKPEVISEYASFMTQKFTTEEAGEIIAYKVVDSFNDYHGGKHLVHDEYIKLKIKDFHLINDKYKQYVIDIYALGIMQGNKEDKINPQNAITRSEATSVIFRMVDKAKRLSFILQGVKSIELETSEGHKGLLIAPMHDSVVLNEMIELIEAVKAVDSETLGVEEYGMNSDASGFGISAFENQRKIDELDDIEIRYKNGEVDEIDFVEETLKFVQYRDWSLGVSLIEHSKRYHPESYVKKRGPYNVRIDVDFLKSDDEQFQWSEENDKIFGRNTYDYIMKYHKKAFEVMFKLWFEDEYDKAWGIFEKALKYYNLETDANGNFKVQGEELTINNRNFFIHYFNGGVGFTVSLKSK